MGRHPQKFKPKYATPRSPRPSSPSKSNSQPKSPLTFDPEATHFETTPRRRPPPSAARIRALRRPIGVVLAALAAGISGYAFYQYRISQRRADEAAKDPPPADASARFQSIADEYDACIGNDEWLWGISKRRKELLSKAKGHVLEASVGTGRNSPYYPLTKGVKSVTMVDQSSEMVRVARMNWAKTNAYYIHAMFRIQSVREPVPFPVASPEGFDTVVQTMGVCSEGDPVGVLRNLGRMCKPNGRVLLLEHGRGRYEWVNDWLDRDAPAHAKRWGCWHNKDVGEIVRESGLEVVEERRYHFGTTWWFVLKPPKDRRLLQDATVPAFTAAVEEKSRPWWTSWWK